MKNTSTLGNLFIFIQLNIKVNTVECTRMPWHEWRMTADTQRNRISCLTEYHLKWKLVAMRLSKYTLNGTRCHFGLPVTARMHTTLTQNKQWEKFIKRKRYEFVIASQNGKKSTNYSVEKWIFREYEIFEKERGSSLFVIHGTFSNECNVQNVIHKNFSYREN